MKSIKTLCIILAAAFLTGCVSSQSTDPMDKVTTADNDSAAALFYIKEGKLDFAESKLQEAFKADPNAIAPWYTRAYLEEVTGHKVAAEKDFKTAIKMDPHSGPAHNNYATFLCHEGRVDHAIKEFLTATKEPNYYNISAAYENAAICAMYVSKFKLAKNYFKQSLAQDPYRPLSLYSLALINYLQHNYPEARDYFSQYQKVVAKLPKKALVLKHYLSQSHHPAITFLPIPLSKRELKS